MNKSAKQYLQKVNKQIHCSSSMKRTFLRQLKNEVLCFCDDNSKVDMALLVENFGSPEEVTEEFFSELGNFTANRYFLTRKRLLYITIGVALSAVIFVSFISIRTDSLKQNLLKEVPVASIIYEGESENNSFRLPSWYRIFDGKGNESDSTENNN